MPRRARCRSCLVTHVLLPVVVLLRRAYSAATIVSVFVSRAAGRGHRSIALAVGVPAGTVRGWLRRMSGRLDAVRKVFLAVAVGVLPGLVPPSGGDGPWQDLLAAVGAGMTAMRSRFGPVAVGEVTATGLAVAWSGGRLLAPGWPDGAGGGGATRVVPVAQGF